MLHSKLIYRVFNPVFFLFLVLFLISFNSELYSQFGKNKVQYQDFNWKYIETKYFDIYFHDDAQKLAEFAAIHTEEALNSIQRTLNYKLSKRVSIIIYASHNEFQQTNVVNIYLSEGIGGVTELLKNRVVVPFQGDYSQFRHVLHHELVHAVLNDMLYGGTFQTSLYTGANIQFPLWMNEGLCEYESLGGMDTQTDMFIRDLAISESLPELQDLEGYLAYRGGQTFYWYVATKYGAERIGELINRLKITGRLEPAFKATFQMSFEDFSEQWKKDMKKYFWPDIEKFEDPGEFAIRLTDHKKEQNFYNTSPAISPDGSKMAYISDKGGLFAIFISDVAPKAERRKLISSLRKQDFEDLNLLTPGISWNPEGTKLVVSAKSGGEDAIFIVDVKTGKYEKHLLNFKAISSVNWSPVEDKICFTAIQNDRSDIFIFNLKNQEVVRLTNDFFSDTYPVWSIDGKKIYFISDRGDYLDGDLKGDFLRYNFGATDIYSIDLETKAIKRLTFTPDYLKTSIVATPDTNKILFVSDENGIWNIYELNLSTGIYKPKTNSLTGIAQISISRDGTNLIFSTLTNGGFDIFQIKNPLERTLKSDTLPLTKLRESFLEKKRILQDIQTKQEEIKVEEKKEELKGYGNFDIEFSRQELVKSNPDVYQKVDVSENAIKGLDSTKSFIIRDYKLRFTPDIVLGNPGYSTLYGFQGVAQAMFSDILGDHQIYIEANLIIDLKNSNIYASYLYLPNKIDYEISAFHQAAYVWRSDGDLYRFRRYGGTITAYYPFDLFTRIEWGFSLINSTRDNIYNPEIASASRFLFVPETRFVYDDALWGDFGPIMGTRYYVGIKGTPKFSSSSIGFMNITGDARHYFYFGEYISLALRGTAGISLGPNPQKVSLGGMENWINATFRDGYLPFDEPEDFMFTQFVMPMRGVSVNERTGNHFFLTNIELRFPLIRALVTGPIPILIHSIMGCVFMDMGGAWYGNISDFKATKINPITREVEPNHLLMSMGFGVRAYILGLPVKMDIAWQNLYHNWTKPYYLFSLGYDF